jgi:hypothetical protein
MRYCIRWKLGRAWQTKLECWGRRGPRKIEVELRKQCWNVGEELWTGEMCAEAGIEGLGRISDLDHAGRYEVWLRFGVGMR